MGRRNYIETTHMHFDVLVIMGFYPSLPGAFKWLSDNKKKECLGGRKYFFNPLVEKEG